MKKFLFVLAAMLLSACGGTVADVAGDCGDSCVAECAFTGKDQRLCVESCNTCDGKPQPNFSKPGAWTADPNPSWLDCDDPHVVQSH